MGGASVWGGYCGTFPNDRLLEGLLKAMSASSSSSQEVLLPLGLSLSVDRHRCSFDTKDQGAKTKSAASPLYFALDRAQPAAANSRPAL